MLKQNAGPGAATASSRKAKPKHGKPDANQPANQMQSSRFLRGECSTYAGSNGGLMQGLTVKMFILSKL
jgi:hypothetical protein